MHSWASLVAQCLRIHLSVQGTQVWSLVQEDPTCHKAAKPMCHNHWTSMLQLLKHTCPRACAPQHEKPPKWEVTARDHPTVTREIPRSNETQSNQKFLKNYFKEKPILVFKSRKIKASGYPPNSTPMLQQNGLNTECLHPLMEQLHWAKGWNPLKIFLFRLIGGNKKSWIPIKKHSTPSTLLSRLLLSRTPASILVTCLVDRQACFPTVSGQNYPSRLHIPSLETQGKCKGL